MDCSWLELADNMLEIATMHSEEGIAPSGPMHVVRVLFRVASLQL